MARIRSLIYSYAGYISLWQRISQLGSKKISQGQGLGGLSINLTGHTSLAGAIHWFSQL